jgi:hypothetical protein
LAGRIQNPATRLPVHGFNPVVPAGALQLCCQEILQWAATGGIALDHGVSPLQKLFHFLNEPDGEGKGMSRFFLGNEAKGIVYDPMPFTPHLVENVDIVMKFLAQSNFGKLNGNLVLSFSRNRSY